jgi:hypothetical protein
MTAELRRGVEPANELSKESVVRAARTQVGCTLGDEVMILNLEDGVYYGLDAVGARIWELLQEPRTLLEVRDTLTSEFDVDEARCERDLLDLVRQLVDAGLAEVESQEARAPGTSPG